MEILDYTVYNIDNAAIQSGYPMNPKPERDREPTDGDYARLTRLGNAPQGSGHDCAIKGILVDHTVEARQDWWIQFLRYSFVQISSSTSKSHSIEKMAPEPESYTDEVDDEIIRKFLEYVEAYKEDKVDFNEVIANCPMGLTLTAGIQTNYMQLKTIYNQRKNHKSWEWQKYIDWIKKLPESYIITGGE